ncbi:MAG: hypothetical protein GEU89_21280, partial [Kiloniellaceae bacterium]|nr:hypothetical protein [Kiloniellaceae bacterium]
CTVLVNGQPTRSCITLAVQARTCEVDTVEGLGEDQELDPLQAAFIDNRAFQCGFCTPGMLMALRPLWDSAERVTEDTVRQAICGNVCRCTGYQPIVRAALDAFSSGGRHGGKKP